MICRFEREDDHIPNCSLDGVRGINETGSTTDGDLLEVSTRPFLYPKRLTLCVALAADVPEASVTVTVLVTVDVAAPPPSLTQMTMISSTDEPEDLLLPPFPLLIEIPVSSSTAPRSTRSAWRVPANANGAAQSVATAENLMVIYILENRNRYRMEMTGTTAALRYS